MKLNDRDFTIIKETNNEANRIINGHNNNKLTPCVCNGIEPTLFMSENSKRFFYVCNKCNKSTSKRSSKHDAKVEWESLNAKYLDAAHATKMAYEYLDRSLEEQHVYQKSLNNALIAERAHELVYSEMGHNPATYLWSYMMGVQRDYSNCVPPTHIGTFSACDRMLDEMPEWKARLPEMARAFPRWAKIIENWDYFKISISVHIKSDEFSRIADKMLAETDAEIVANEKGETIDVYAGVDEEGNPRLMEQIPIDPKQTKSGIDNSPEQG